MVNFNIIQQRSRSMYPCNVTAISVQQSDIFTSSRKPLFCSFAFLRLLLFYLYVSLESSLLRHGDTTIVCVPNDSLRASSISAALEKDLP